MRINVKEIEYIYKVRFFIKNNLFYSKKGFIFD